VSHDTLIHRIIRPLIRRVAPLGVTPNQITTLRLITGLAAAACFAAGTRSSFDVGAGVFVLSMLLDRADGELARQTGQTSKSGHQYDLASDWIGTVVAFLGIGVGLASSLGEIAIALGLVAGVAAGVLFWQSNILKLEHPPGYRAPNGRVLFDPDDAMLAVPLFIWIGLAASVLVVAATLAPALAIWRLARSTARRPG
jgi:archaetidylinositol phosphate synthase